MSRKIALQVKNEESPFFRNLQELYPAANKSQLAEILGVKPPAITPYIKKGRLPELPRLIKICKDKGVSLHWLVFREGPKQVSPYSVEPANQVVLNFDSAIYVILQELAKQDGLLLEQKTIELLLSSLVVCGTQATDIFNEDRRRQLLLDLLDISQAKPKKRRQPRRVDRAVK